MKTLAVIPARYGSSRFPGKPLALIGGKPMLQHVYERVSDSMLFDKVAVATDDERIFEAARTIGAEVFMTSPDHPSGTDRCAEVLDCQELKFDIVINIQGDEPFISEEPLRQLLSLFENPLVEIGTLVQEIRSEEEMRNPNIVKAVITSSGQALYFSRSPIPYVRDEKNANKTTFWKHIGIYGYQADILKKIVSLSPSLLEQTESLEQLRWLENGFRIFAEKTDYRMLAVDTPEDLERAETFHQQIFLNQ